MNERLSKYSKILKDWASSGFNYSPPVDWIELNQIAIDLGSSPYQIGCSDCRKSLIMFIHDTIKERGL